MTEINYRICKLSPKNETKNCVENFTGVVWYCVFLGQNYIAMWDGMWEERRGDVMW